MDFDGLLTTAVGCMPHIHEGEFIRLFGAWTEHKVYGQQFAAKSVGDNGCRTRQSRIKMFLASGLIKGVGEALAGRIVDRFGEETFDVIENSPELFGGSYGHQRKDEPHYIRELFGAHRNKTDNNRAAEPGAVCKAGVSGFRELRQRCGCAHFKEPIQDDRRYCGHWL